MHTLLKKGECVFLSFYGILGRECITSFFASHTIREVIEMTEKELLYVEDALGHEQHFKKACCDTKNQLQDPKLKACVTEMEKKHQQLFQSFYNLL